jgi:hypothetical protein
MKLGEKTVNFPDKVFVGVAVITSAQEPFYARFSEFAVSPVR